MQDALFPEWPWYSQPLRQIDVLFYLMVAVKRRWLGLYVLGSLWEKTWPKVVPKSDAQKGLKPADKIVSTQ